MPQEAAKKKGKVVSLEDFREKRRAAIPTIEIRLLPTGGVDYDTSNLREQDAFQALIGCYALAGDLMQTIRKHMSNRSEGCGTSD